MYLHSKTRGGKQIYVTREGTGIPPPPPQLPFPLLTKQLPDLVDSPNMTLNLHSAHTIKFFSKKVVLACVLQW